VEVARRALREVVLELAPDARATFRVATKRADKRFPIHSADFDRYVAERILGEFPQLAVRLKGSELTLGIDIRPERTYVFARRLPGLGGLPVGTQGRVLCLISGGFDSPVAPGTRRSAAARCTSSPSTSHPFIGEPARKKVVDVVRVLARYQAQTELHVVPFAAVPARDPRPGHESYRTVLYRRMMQRIATALAAESGALALVTGDSLGQVASQTLENLTCIGAAAGLPVLRPLIGFDKQETIALARRIGTHDLSALQEPDCCTLFMPSRPVIRGRVETCEELEARLDVAALVGAKRSPSASAWPSSRRSDGQRCMNRTIALLLASAVLLAHMLAIHKDAADALAPPTKVAHVAFREAHDLAQHGVPCWDPTVGGASTYRRSCGSLWRRRQSASSSTRARGCRC
jgi:thiamine biosynthesis protein ThiI